MKYWEIGSAKNKHTQKHVSHFFHFSVKCAEEESRSLKKNFTSSGQLCHVLSIILRFIQLFASFSYFIGSYSA